jgi:ribonuclease P protein component
MFKKVQRLTRQEFLNHFKKGRRYNTEYLTGIVHTYPTLHVAVVVSKKVSKLATTRNAIRRRLYAQLRNGLYKKHTGVFIVVVKPGCLKASKATVKAQIDQLVERMVKPA